MSDTRTGQVKQIVIREARDDFGAFKICAAVLESGGEVITVTVSPNVVFDHNRGHQVATPEGGYRWIVWATFADTFNPNVLDEAIEAEESL